MDRLALLPVSLDRPAMNTQRASEGVDRREKALLKTRYEECGGRLLSLGLALEGCSRSSRYWSSSSESRSSGVSAGRPSMSSCFTIRLGNSPAIARRSSLRRRTMTSSRNLGCTVTPRQNRWGSRISRSAEKLLGWPLCGVAERNKRCSNRPATSRIARVNLESIAYLAPLDGAAWWASSRINNEPGRKSPSQSRRVAV